MNFSEVVEFVVIMFVYVLPALVTLLIILWFKDWIVKVAAKWKRSAEKKYALMQEDRWFVILEIMKVFLFLILLLPLIVVINYAIDEDASDPAPTIFRETMPYVFIVIVLWYSFAAVLYGVYWKNKEDKEREAEERLLRGAV